MPKPKAHQHCHLIVFADHLEDWFDALYPPNPGRARPNIQSPDSVDQIADLLFQSRPRLTAEDVNRILQESGAPPAWAYPSACVGAGTIFLRQSAAFCDAQEAFHQLRRSLRKWITELRGDRELGANARSFLAEQGGDETGANWTRAEEYEILLRDLDTAPRFQDLRVHHSVYSWHYSAVLLYDRYNQIVGSSRPSAKGPAVRFVQEMLQRLDIHKMATESAIEKVLTRGMPELRAYGVDSRTTKTGELLSPPNRR